MKKAKKGFTIVELVIVIAVIAILAGVLIPTFASVTKKARISADTQLCRNMNTALDIAKADGAQLDTMEDVLFAINEAGYIVENLNPTTQGYYYAWDSENGRIVFLNDKLAVHYPENAQINKATSWVTVGNQAEAQAVAAEGYAVYVEPKFEGSLTLNKLVNVDAGAKRGLTLSIDSNASGEISISGNFDKVTLDVPNASVNQFGTVKTLDVVAVKVGTLNVNGYVEKLSVTAGKVEVKATGIVKEVTAGEDKIADTSTGLVAGKAPADYTYAINNKTDLYSFRDAVNAGYDFAGKTVKLNADIDLAGVAWLPIGNVYRDNATKNGIVGFAGTFDGNNHKIKNLSNGGFAAASIANGKNKSANAYIEIVENEVVFGFFGCVKNATIKNLTVNANITDVGSEFVGDGVGAIVGYAYGNSFVMDNCKATGSIDASDGVGGLVGRIYVVGYVAEVAGEKNNIAGSITITNCVNDATVGAKLPSGYGSAGKAGGIVGYISPSTSNATEIKKGEYVLDGKEVYKKANLTISGCVNNGNVSSAKYKGDFFVGSSGVLVGGVALTNNAGYGAEIQSN